MYDTKRYNGDDTIHRKIYNKLTEQGWEEPKIKFCTIGDRRGWWAWNKSYEKEPEFLGKNPLKKRKPCGNRSNYR